MSEKKHIDRLFQEKFKDFEAKPGANVWAGIQNKLDVPQEKAKTGIPIWLRIAGIAAALVLLFTIGNSVFNTRDLQINDNTVVEIDNNNLENNKSNNNNTQDNTLKENANNSKNSKGTIDNENTTLNNEAVVTNQSETKNNFLSETPKNKKTKLKENTLHKKETSNNNLNTTSYTTNNVNKSNNSSQNNLANSKITNSVSNTIKNSIAKTTAKDEKVLNVQNNSPSYSQSNVEDKINKSSNPINTAITNTNTNKPNTKAQDALDNNTAISNTVVAATNSEEEKRKEEEKMMEPDSANSSKTIEEALAKIEDLDEKEENVNRWLVSANAAPVYYNTLGKGSHIDDQFIENTKNGGVNSSYGINVGYALNNRLTVRSGINNLNLSYDTSNVIVYENVSHTPSGAPLKTIDFSKGEQKRSLSVLSGNNFKAEQNSDLVSDMIITGVSQRLNYLEVPLELQYAVVKKRFGINLIGGVSTFILSDNEIVTEMDGRDTKIGEANNLNDVSFSANAGIGIDYKFSDSFKFNFEPTFKYQINAYSETSGDFKPYIIGVYTGFSYKF